MNEPELRTARCKVCRKNTHYDLVGVTHAYIACRECGAIFNPVKGDQLAVFNELKGIFNLELRKEQEGGKEEA